MTSIFTNKPADFFLILAFVLLMPLSGSTQNIGIGADAIYNFQTESIGAGARVSIYPNHRLSIVPQFSYFFAFNKVNEYYAGLALEYKFIIRDKVHFYALAHGAYDNWINYAKSPMKDAKPNNFDLEGGVGVSTNGCLRPFLEFRYNARFRESNLHLGILYIFGCNNRSRRDRCDAYNS